MLNLNKKKKDKKTMKNMFKMLAMLMLIIANCSAAAATTNTATTTATATTTPPDKVFKWSVSFEGVGMTSVENAKYTLVGPQLGLSCTAPFVFHIPMEIGVRQGVLYGATVNCPVFDTEAFSDIHIPFTKHFSAFLGPVFTTLNGSCIISSWYVGPEAGFRYNLSDNLYLVAKGGYNFRMNDVSTRTGDTIGYGIGVGFSW
jgi:hypothetical protein